MKLAPRFAALALGAGLTVASLSEAATVKQQEFKPTSAEIKAAAGRPMPKTEAEKTADTAGEVGKVTHTSVPGAGILNAGRSVADSGKKLGSIFGVGSSQASRVLLAEAIDKNLAQGPVVVAFGAPAQTDAVFAAIKSDNFKFEGTLTFIAVDDTAKPLKGDWKNEHEALVAANGTPLVVFHTKASGAENPAFAVNGALLGTAEGAKTAAAKLADLIKPPAVAPAAPASTNAPAASTNAPAPAPK